MYKLLALALFCHVHAYIYKPFFRSFDMFEEENKREDNYFCEICEFSCRSRKVFEDHMKEHKKWA